MRAKSSPAFLAASLALAGALHAAPPAIVDVFPPSRRQPTVDLATRLSASPQIPRLPEKLVSPFNPPSFDAPDPEEMRAAAEAADAARRAGLAANRPASARELLESIANQLKPTGMASLGGQAILLMGRNRYKIGDPIEAEYGDRKIVVIISAIDRTTFTLRLNGEEFTRPIKSGK